MQNKIINFRFALNIFLIFFIGFSIGFILNIFMNKARMKERMKMQPQGIKIDSVSYVSKDKLDALYHPSGQNFYAVWINKKLKFIHQNKLGFYIKENKQ